MINKKYLAQALKHQNNFDAFGLGNDNYNIATFGTDLKHAKLVSQARWAQSGFLKNKLTKKELELWLKYNYNGDV